MFIKRTSRPDIIEFVNNTTWLNEVLLAGLFFASGALWPFVYEPTGISNNGTILLYQVSTVAILAINSVWYVQGFFNHFRCKKDPGEKQKRLGEELAILDAYRHSVTYSIAVDAKRKFLHLLPGLVIIIVEVVSFSLERIMPELFYQLGINRKAFSIFGETLVAYLFVFMIGYADYLRLAAFHQLPYWARRWFFSSVKRSEMRTFVSSCALVLTLTPFLFAPVQVFVSVAFVSSLADAAASLIGHKFGRRNFPKGSPKTEWGYIAGTGSAFMVVLLFSSLFNYTSLPLLSIFYIACAAAAIFFIIDAFVRDLSDNILNPLLTGAGMLFVFFFMI